MHDLEEMQAEMDHVEEGIKLRLSETEEERDRAIANLKEIKSSNADDLNTAKSSGKVADIDTEVAKMKHSLQTSDEELEKKEREIKLLSEELERKKESETKMLDSFAAQTKQLEQTKILLEETKSEITSSREHLNKREAARDSSGSGPETGSLEFELKLLRENLARAEEAEKSSSSKIMNLMEEMRVLKHELNLATEAEEQSKKAMDDLALVLKEVAMDCSQANEKLAGAEVQLEAARLECEELNEKLKSTEENYESLLEESRKKAELHKNIADRLREEAEESLLAWNGKEAVFVSCIKRAEEEKNSALEENSTLLKALMETEEATKKAKEENHKLRDILKQAINEANVAKEAAAIARAENSQLQDVLSEKDKIVDFLTRENENLKHNEATARENINGLRSLLSEASQENHRNIEEKEYKNQLRQINPRNKDLDKKFSSQILVEKEAMKESNAIENHRLALKGAKIANKNTGKGAKEDGPNDGRSPLVDPDPLKGSIFDVADTAASQAEATKIHHRKSPPFAEDGGETLNLEELEHLEESENDKNSRKKKALLRRFGDLLGRRKSLHKSTPSMEQ